MPELRSDPITGRWVVVVAPERSLRPHELGLVEDEPAFESCPFCPGHEDATPQALLARRDGETDGGGWSLRVVPNQFPALRVEMTEGRSGEGMYDRMAGVGAHEVVIETPRHGARLADLDVGQIGAVFQTWAARIADLEGDRRLKHVAVFRNEGARAGATLRHPHSQLIATPVVPPVVQAELDGARTWWSLKQRCVWCDVVHAEQADGRRLVYENAHALVFCPWAPRFPFETWVVPKKHTQWLHRTAPEVLAGTAEALREALVRLDRALDLAPYNLVVHTAPFSLPKGEVFHWHVEILPALVTAAGFEWATGCHINPVPPEEAAGALRAVPSSG